MKHQPTCPTVAADMSDMGPCQCEPTAANMTATGEWVEPTLVNIDADTWYIVQTNGMEWRDADLFVWKGIAITMRLKPEIVRGRPMRIAKINL